MKSNPSSGIVTRQSVHSVDETVRKLEDALKAKGITLFAAIDPSGEAERVGLRIPNTKLLIFGHPRAGTPIMIASPSAAIRPAAQDSGVGRRRGRCLALLQQHKLPSDQARLLAGTCDKYCRGGGSGQDCGGMTRARRTESSRWIRKGCLASDL